MPPTQRLGQEVSARRVKALGKTERFGERSFFLYGTPVRDGRAIVVASQSIIDRAGAAEPLTSDDQAVWAGSLTAASDYCAAVTESPTATPPVGTPST